MCIFYTYYNCSRRYEMVFTLCTWAKYIYVTIWLLKCIQYHPHFETTTTTNDSIWFDRIRLHFKQTIRHIIKFCLAVCERHSIAFYYTFFIFIMMKFFKIIIKSFKIKRHLNDNPYACTTYVHIYAFKKIYTNLNMVSTIHIQQYRMHWSLYLHIICSLFDCSFCCCSSLYIHFIQLHTGLFCLCVYVSQLRLCWLLSSN